MSAQESIDEGQGTDVAPAVPWHADAFAAEYRAALEGCAVFDRADRAQLVLRGRDPLRMIQGLITNDLAGAPPARGVAAAVLTAKGRMVAEIRAFRLEDGAVLVDTAAAAYDSVLEHIRKFVPPLFARPDPPQPPLRVLGVYGPTSAEVVSAIVDAAPPIDAPEESFTQPSETSLALLARTDAAGVPGYDVFVTAAQADMARRALIEAGAREAGSATFDVLRIEAGRPVWGAELDAERIPLEAGLLERAISTTKGCYTGQEVIVRILHRGHVNWQLRGVLAGVGADLPQVGDPLFRQGGDKPLGRVTSACHSPRMNQPVALAYVRREVEPPEELRLRAGDGWPVRIVALPFPIAGDGSNATEAG